MAYEPMDRDKADHIVALPNGGSPRPVNECLQLIRGINTFLDPYLQTQRQQRAQHQQNVEQWQNVQQRHNAQQQRDNIQQRQNIQQLQIVNQHQNVQRQNVQQQRIVQQQPNIQQRQIIHQHQNVQRQNVQQRQAYPQQRAAASTQPINNWRSHEESYQLEKDRHSRSQQRSFHVQQQLAISQLGQQKAIQQLRQQPNPQLRATTSSQPTNNWRSSQESRQLERDRQSRSQQRSSHVQQQLAISQLGQQQINRQIRATISLTTSTQPSHNWRSSHKSYQLEKDRLSRCQQRSAHVQQQLANAQVGRQLENAHIGQQDAIPQRGQQQVNAQQRATTSTQHSKDWSSSQESRQLEKDRQNRSQQRSSPTEHDRSRSRSDHSQEEETEGHPRRSGHKKTKFLSHCPFNECKQRSRNIKKHVMLKHLPVRFRAHALKNWNRHGERIKSLIFLAQRLTDGGSILDLYAKVSTSDCFNVPLNCKPSEADEVMFGKICKRENWKIPTKFQFIPINSPAVLFHWRVLVSVVNAMTKEDQELFRELDMDKKMDEKMDDVNWEVVDSVGYDDCDTRVTASSPETVKATPIAATTSATTASAATPTAATASATTASATTASTTTAAATTTTASATPAATASATIAAAATASTTITSTVSDRPSQVVKVEQFPSMPDSSSMSWPLRSLPTDTLPTRNLSSDTLATRKVTSNALTARKVPTDRPGARKVINIVTSHFHLDHCGVELATLNFEKTFFQDYFKLGAADPELEFFVNVIGGVVVCDAHDFPEVINLPPGFGVTIGLHPQNAGRLSGEVYTQIKRSICQPHVIALGDIGLDHTQDQSTWKQQEETLVKLLELAPPSLPVVLHIRDTGSQDDLYQQCLQIMAENVAPKQRLHLHAFTGNVDTVERWTTKFHNCYFGYTGLCEGFNFQQKAAMRSVPLNRLLLETDSRKFSMNVNGPVNIGKVLSQMSGILNRSVEEVAKLTVQNAKELYGLNC